MHGPINDDTNHEGHLDILSRIKKMGRPGMVPHTGDIQVEANLRAGGELDFVNSWGNKGGIDETASFHIAEDGKVHFNGTVAGGAVGTVIFTLPEGFRPKRRRRFTVPVDDGSRFGTVWVYPNGDVKLVAISF